MMLDQSELGDWDIILCLSSHCQCILVLGGVPSRCERKRERRGWERREGARGGGGGYPLVSPLDLKKERGSSSPTLQYKTNLNPRPEENRRAVCAGTTFPHTRHRKPPVKTRCLLSPLPFSSLLPLHNNPSC